MDILREAGYDMPEDYLENLDTYGKLIIEFQNGDFILFGISCGETCDDYLPLPFASGAEEVDVNGPVPFEKDKYWLLRYAN